MRILVYGVGAIGSLLTHFLCEAGNDVTIVARSTYEELKNNGLVIRHHLQKKTTVDHPRVLKEYDGAHYDIIFSVMQGQQQVALLPVLASVDADLLVLVGNNMETDKCEELLAGRRHVYAFQGSAGHRENGITVVGRLPATDLTVGGLHEPASDADISLIKTALYTKGYKVTPVSSMYGYYMYHFAEVMPYCYLCYHVGCDLKRADRGGIKKVMTATKECFDYLRLQGIPVMPEGEEAYYDGGAKTFSMYLLYRLMSRTVLGDLMVADHCKNAVSEMKYLDSKFEEYRESHGRSFMPVWDEMRPWLNEA